MKSKKVNDEFLRKRKERQKKIRKRRLLISFIVLLIFSLITAVILSLTVLFPIKKIIITGSKVYNTNQLTSAFEEIKGDNIFAVSKKATIEKIKKELPFVEDIAFERALPDTLKIIVTDAKEYACYEIDGKLFTVSQSGWVLASYDQLPQNVFKVIAKVVKCKVGTQIELKNEDDAQLIDKISQILQNNKLDIDYIDITNSINLKIGVEKRFDVDYGTLNFLEEKTKHLKSMTQNIPQNKCGNINLSMWNNQNTQGTFVEKDRK